ncbi:hypothetical protein ACIBKX_33450 [Streptomyces sp. NPDC050658]|uniref:hypothetical protein n=1 Tax=unclassified Streptomyces TaxID=2593676 RepID=UPI00341EEC20
MHLTRTTWTAVALLLAASTGCTAGDAVDDRPRAEENAAVAPLPGLSTKAFEAHLAKAGWQLTYRNLEASRHIAQRLRQGSGVGHKSQRFGVMESGALPGSMASVTCQSFGKDQEAAQKFLAACASVPATRGAGRDAFNGWLGNHIDQTSRGSGHELALGLVTYHLAVSAKKDVFALNMARTKQG